eukprot:scaffold1650_cov124-Isochrysis_galbana.AAC.6
MQARRSRQSTSRPGCRVGALSHSLRSPILGHWASLGGSVAVRRARRAGKWRACGMAHRTAPTCACAWTMPNKSSCAGVRLGLCLCGERMLCCGAPCCSAAGRWGVV